jgi:hypothetical protein
VWRGGVSSDEAESGWLKPGSTQLSTMQRESSKISQLKAIWQPASGSGGGGEMSQLESGVIGGGIEAKLENIGISAASAAAIESISESETQRGGVTSSAQLKYKRRMA